MARNNFASFKKKIPGKPDKHFRFYIQYQFSRELFSHMLYRYTDFWRST